VTAPLLVAAFAAGGCAAAGALWFAAASGARAIDVSIGAFPWWCGAGAAALALFAGALDAWSLAAGAAAVALVAAFVCALTDLRSGYVFDRALAVAAILVLAFGAGGLLMRAESALAIGALFAAPYLLSRGRGFGLGDVKLGALLGAGLGMAAGLSMFVASFVAGAVFAVVALALKRMDRKTVLPFAPFIAVGAAIGLALPLRLAV
jgi:prepilin signal peptidase PulO-like enzyme (type II secretory pathway)